MSTSMRKWLVDQWRADQVTRGRCEGRVCEAHLKLTAPCHNCSYLSVGGEWISSMNNRLSLIFLGEPRLPISQLISEFSLLLIYRRILSRDWEWGGRGGGWGLLNPLGLLLSPLKKSQMLSGSPKPPKMSTRGRTSLMGYSKDFHTQAQKVQGKAQRN